MKTTISNQRTNQQNIRLHTLIGLLNIDAEQKSILVEDASKGRVTSSADLTKQECDYLLNHLQNIINNQTNQSAANKMRKKIMSMSHELGWETASGGIDYKQQSAWLLKYGYLHKELKHYTEAELPTLVTQIENMINSRFK